MKKINFPDLAGMSPLLASSMKTLDSWAENLLEQLEESFPEGCPPDLLPPLTPGYSLQQSLADPNCSPFRQHTQVGSLQDRPAFIFRNHAFNRLLYLTVTKRKAVQS